MLESRIQGADEREMLEEAMEAVELGAQLSNRLLAFGRRQTLDPKPIMLTSLVAGMHGMLRRTLGATIEIDLRLTDDLPPVVTDPGQFENALLNLAINARDAMPNGGQLLIETGLAELDADYAEARIEVVPGRYAVLSVTDTGIGMTPEVQERAFEPFFTTKATGSGTGLGLSMVYGFVKQSGGHVQLYSEIGRGTTIRIYLPAGDPIGGSDALQDAPLAIRGSAGEIVLVVEDDAMVRRVTVRRLQEFGYSVVDTDSAVAALEVIDRGEPIDLLFTDVVMPGGMTGIDLAHEVRRRRPDLKILFTSGYAEPAMRNRDALKTDAAWLSKPYNAKALQGKLRELLDD
jgi:CheY-like chemotaxis protein